MVLQPSGTWGAEARCTREGLGVSMGSCPSHFGEMIITNCGKCAALVAIWRYSASYNPIQLDHDKRGHAI